MHLDARYCILTKTRLVVRFSYQKWISTWGFLWRAAFCSRMSLPPFERLWGKNRWVGKTLQLVFSKDLQWQTPKQYCWHMFRMYLQKSYPSYLMVITSGKQSTTSTGESSPFLGRIGEVKWIHFESAGPFSERFRNDICLLYIPLYVWIYTIIYIYIYRIIYPIVYPIVYPMRSSFLSHGQTHPKFSTMYITTMLGHHSIFLLLS